MFFFIFILQRESGSRSRCVLSSTSSDENTNGNPNRVESNAMFTDSHVNDHSDIWSDNDETCLMSELRKDRYRCTRTVRRKDSSSSEDSYNQSVPYPALCETQSRSRSPADRLRRRRVSHQRPTFCKWIKIISSGILTYDYKTCTWCCNPLNIISVMF